MCPLFASEGLLPRESCHSPGLVCLESRCRWGLQRALHGQTGCRNWDLFVLVDACGLRYCSRAPAMASVDFVTPRTRIVQATAWVVDVPFPDTVGLSGKRLPPEVAFLPGFRHLHRHLSAPVAAAYGPADSLSQGGPNLRLSTQER